MVVVVATLAMVVVVMLLLVVVVVVMVVVEVIVMGYFPFFFLLFIFASLRHWTFLVLFQEAKLLVTGEAWLRSESRVLGLNLWVSLPKRKHRQRFLCYFVVGNVRVVLLKENNVQKEKKR